MTSSYEASVHLLQSVNKINFSYIICEMNRKDERYTSNKNNLFFDITLLLFYTNIF